MLLRYLSRNLTLLKSLLVYGSEYGLSSVHRGQRAEPISWMRALVGQILSSPAMGDYENDGQQRGCTAQCSLTVSGLLGNWCFFHVPKVSY
jgi:hypothetical protein